MAERFLSIRSVVAWTTLSRSEIYRRIKAGAFPEQVKLGLRRVAWRQSEIDSWIQTQCRAGA